MKTNEQSKKAQNKGLEKYQGLSIFIKKNKRMNDLPEHYVEHHEFNYVKKN